MSGFGKRSQRTGDRRHFDLAFFRNALCMCMTVRLNQFRDGFEIILQTCRDAFRFHRSAFTRLGHLHILLLFHSFATSFDTSVGLVSRSARNDFPLFRQIPLTTFMAL